MKNTRISRLRHNKRIKQVSNVITVGLLICPLAIGAIQALANEAETPASTEEVATLETAESTEVSLPEVAEEIKPEEAKPLEQIVESDVPEQINSETQKIESLPILMPTATNNVLVTDIGLSNDRNTIFSGQTVQFTATVLPENATNKTVIWSTSNPSVATIDQNGLLTGLSDGLVNVQATSSDGNVISYSYTIVVRISIEEYLAPTRNQVKAYQQQVAELQAAGATTEQLERTNELIKAALSNLWLVEYSMNNNPEYELGWLGNFHDIDNMIFPEIEDEIQKIKDELNQAETVNYTIKCVDEYGYPVYGVSDITKSAKKGSSVTETAPEIEYFFVLESTTQTKTIGDNTVFTFTYRRLTATNQFYDVIGDTTAKVGETKTYQYNQVMFYNNGTMTETIFNVEDTSLPLTSSDPSDVIVNGTITFGSEGTRTLSASNAGMSLEVTVTKDGVTPPVKEVDTSKLEESIRNAEAKLTAGGYTKESTKDLQTALQCAKDILAKSTSTQAEIDEAQKALDLAIAGLVKAEDPNSNNTGNNSSNSTGNSNTDPNNSNNGTANNTNNQSNHNNSQNSNTTTTKPTGNNTNKDGLPQTGEQSTTNAVIAGLSLTMLSMLAWFKRKKV